MPFIHEETFGLHLSSLALIGFTLVFSLLGVCWAFGIYTLMFFIKFRKFVFSIFSADSLFSLVGF